MWQPVSRSPFQWIRPNAPGRRGAGDPEDVSQVRAYSNQSGRT